MQLEEDLNRARCIIVDGDASSFLPGKAESMILFVLFSGSAVASFLFVCGLESEFCGVCGFNCHCEYR